MADSRTERRAFADERVGMRRGRWTVRGGEKRGSVEGGLAWGRAGIQDGLAESWRAGGGSWCLVG